MEVWTESTRPRPHSFFYFTATPARRQQTERVEQANELVAIHGTL